MRILTPLRSVQIWGVNGPMHKGVGGLELSTVLQIKLKMACFSPENPLQEQYLVSDIYFPALCNRHYVTIAYYTCTM